MKYKNLIWVVVSLILMIAYIYTRPAATLTDSTEQTLKDDSEIIVNTKTQGRTHYETNREKLVSGEPAPLSTDRGTSNSETLELAKKPIMDLVPSLEEYKSEIAKKPQGAPPSLQKFNQAMDEKLKIALKDQTTARDLLPELGECVKRANVTFAQQVCLVNAKKIKKEFPDLSTEVDAIEKSAPADVKKRAKIMGF
jgi:hypothetical protein